MQFLLAWRLKHEQTHGKNTQAHNIGFQLLDSSSETDCPTHNFTASNDVATKAGVVLGASAWNKPMYSSKAKRGNKSCTTTDELFTAYRWDIRRIWHLCPSSYGRLFAKCIWKGQSKPHINVVSLRELGRQGVAEISSNILQWVTPAVFNISAKDWQEDSAEAGPKVRLLGADSVRVPNIDKCNRDALAPAVCRQCNSDGSCEHFCRRKSL